MNLSPNFTLAELTITEVRADNTCPPELIPELTRTAYMLEGIRSYLSQRAGYQVPVIVNSAWRSPVVNTAIGGAKDSDHMRAMAADIRAPAYGPPQLVCEALAPMVSELGIGQLIHEFGRWIHVSSRAPAQAHNRIITIDRLGARVGILPAR